MHGATQLSWKSALVTGLVVGLAASAIAQDEFTRTSLLARLSPRSVKLAQPTLDARLGELEERLTRAHFSEVAEATRTLRADLQTSGPEARARFEVIAGTAHLALGASAAAVACFKRALVVAPGLELGRRSTSPKVLRAFAAARHQLESERASDPARRVDAPDRPARLIDGPPPLAPTTGGALRPTILCRLLIDARGAVIGATVQRPRVDLARFEQIALATVRGYRFEPALRDGQPISSWLNWPVQF